MKEAKNENPGTLASALLAAQQGIAGVVRDSTRGEVQATPFGLG